jgi:hypothetical protein
MRDNSSLHEQPISGAGNVDLVIYSAQLSQSFFSCLASAVEGFLDLFMSASSSLNGEKEDSSVGSSLHSSSSSKNIPAGAVASIVLWCDGELSKFASAFGGARILANLALSPPPRNAVKQPRVVDGHLDPSGNKERQVSTRLFLMRNCLSFALFPNVCLVQHIIRTQ